MLFQPNSHTGDSMFNLVVVLIFTFLVAFVLVYFISAHDRKLKMQRAGKPRPYGEEGNEFKIFAKFCVELCEYLKLEVKDFTQHPPHELTIRAVNVNPITRVEYLVMGLFLTGNDTLDMATLSNFSDQIVSERISKGILITPAAVSEHLKNLPELAPIDFVDGQKFVEWQKKMIL